MNNLKDLGIVRKVDELGRLVLPIELRKELNINEGDGLALYIDKTNNAIILKPSEAKCTHCGTLENLKAFGKHSICAGCIEGVKNL